MKLASFGLAMAHLAVFAIVGGTSVADDPKGLKSHATAKVIDMLETLRKEVTLAGDAEAKTYDKFACFCKSTTEEKLWAIEDNEDEKKSLEAGIGKKTGARDELDIHMSAMLKTIEDTEKKVEELTAVRKKEYKTYKGESAELTGAKQALGAAVKVLKDMTQKKPEYTLVQLKTAMRGVQDAVAMADAMGLGSLKHRQMMNFLQDSAPEVPMQDYSFGLSESIVEMLEDMLAGFQKESNELDDVEVKAKSMYDMEMQDKTDLVKRKKTEYDVSGKKRGALMTEITELSDKHTGVSAQLADDQQYVSRLHKVCSDKAKTWDQRVKARADELSAIIAAIGIIKDQAQEKAEKLGMKLATTGVAVRRAHEVARSSADMEEIEAETESDYEKAPSLLEVAAVTEEQDPEDDGRMMAAQLLEKEGKLLHSQMLSSAAILIMKEKNDPFAKIKTLIQELIQRLMQQAKEEASQKGWCDSSMAEGEAKRDRNADDIVDINAKMARGEADRDSLDEEIAILDEEIAALIDSRHEAKLMRKEESKGNKRDIKDAKEGMGAVEDARKILEEFYEKAKENTVELQKEVDPELPDAGFKGGEAYTGAQGSSTGVIGMLEVLLSDFERTIDETQTAEEEAQQDFENLMRTSAKSLEAKERVRDLKHESLDDIMVNLVEKKEQLKDKITLLNEAIDELIELKHTCIDTGMSYAERVANREEEIESLKKADCILDNFKSGGADNC